MTRVPTRLRHSPTERTHTVLRRTLAVLFVPLLALSACGDDEGSVETDTTMAGGAGDPADQGLLDDVEVTAGKDGEAPTIEFDQPFAVGTTVRRILEEGDGDEVVDGSTAIFDFVFVNGRDGTELANSFGMEPQPITVEPGLLDGVRNGLLGLKAGSIAIVAIAPEDGFGEDDPSTGVKAEDTVLLYIDLHEVRTPLERAEGTAVDPVEGLPTVELDDAGAPTITVPKENAPTELVAQLLIEGEGAEVESGQTITVHYTGVLWDGGTEFDSSWDGSPASFEIGTGAVIPGWDKGLVGQKVGSQVLLVIPPAEGYGEAGQGSIPAGATLVFVVDILDAG